MQQNNDYAKTVWQVIADIKEAKSVVIYTHINPDGDCNGCAFGLRQLIWDNVDADKKVLVAGKACPKNLAFMGDYDQVSDEFAKESLSIVVDTSAKSRVADQRFAHGTKVVKIDHHLNSEDFGYINIDDHLPSACQQILDFAKQAEWKFNHKSATPILTGLTTDTGRFRHLTKHAERTFRDAAELVSFGADLPLIYANINVRDRSSIPFNQWYMKRVRFESKLAWMVVNRRAQKKFGVGVGDASRWLSNMSDYAGIEVWAQFTQSDNGWRCEYRSKGFPVNEFAARFGGGGHRQAAGSSASDLAKVKEIVAELKKAIE